MRVIGSDNVDQAEIARRAIDTLLNEFGKSWSDIIALLGGDIDALLDDLVRDISKLGSRNPKERNRAGGSIDNLLRRNRKGWNDLVAALSGSHEEWACKPKPADPTRVNPLELVHFLLGEYVALKEHQLVAVSLWCLHTHVFRRYMVTPRLALRSPTAGEGKTTLLDVLSQLAAKAEKFDAITTAALYRVIDKSHPTLLIDEVDNMNIALQPNGRLRAIFNSGHRRGGTIAIVERGELRRFSTFAPLALALPEMVRGLPGTLNSRCITIAMARSPRELRRYDALAPDPALAAAYLQIHLWARDVQLAANPAMPVRNRFADNWRVLIAIADDLGWGEKAREAMAAFAREFVDADVKIILLGDIRRIFNARAVDRLSSAALVDALHNLDGGDWQEFAGVRGDEHPHALRVGELASMLRDFGIRPRTIWQRKRRPTDTSKKGFRREQFADAWARYLDAADGGTPAQSNVVKLLRAAL
jgi:hypothetical protein